MVSKRRRYTREFKIETVRLITDSDQSVSGVASEAAGSGLAMPLFTLHYRWKERGKLRFVPYALNSLGLFITLPRVVTPGRESLKTTKTARFSLNSSVRLLENIAGFVRR